MGELAKTAFDSSLGPYCGTQEVLPMPIDTVVIVLGRTPENNYLVLTDRGNVGWVYEFEIWRLQ